MMIPQAVTPDVSSELAGLYGYCNAVMEPWDGPATVMTFSGNWVIGVWIETFTSLDTQSQKVDFF